MCEFWSGRAGAFPPVLGAGEGLLSPAVYGRCTKSRGLGSGTHLSPQPRVCIPESGACRPVDGLAVPDQAAWPPRAAHLLVS